MKLKAEHIRIALAKLEKEAGEFEFLQWSEVLGQLKLSVRSQFTGEEKVVVLFPASADGTRWPRFQTEEILMGGGKEK